MYRLGMDLGGTKIEGVVLGPDEREMVRERVATEQALGYASILKKIGSVYAKLVAAIDAKPHTFGIGTPGAISLKTGLLKNSNTLCMNGMPLKTDLEKLLGRQIALENDANCFAMAEALAGAGKDHAFVFGVIMGTGCGGGIVHDRKVLRGKQSIAGEWGHMSMDPCGTQCYCGNRGCVETLISGGGLEARYKAEFGEALKLGQIVAKFRAGDPRASEFMSLFFENFGRALANVINILDPDMVVLGGGVSNVDELYSEGIKQVERFVFSDDFTTPIRRNMLGDSAGVIGAALVGV